MHFVTEHTLLYLNFHSTRSSDEVPQTYENLPLPDATNANYENIQRQGNASNYETLQTQSRDNQAYETLQMQDTNKDYETLQTHRRDERVYNKFEGETDGS